MFENALVMVPFVVASMLGDMFARKFNLNKVAGLFQPLTTVLIIVASTLSFTATNVNKWYSILITAGLVISFCGDVILVDRSDKKSFPIGLGIFFIALNLYWITITIFNPFHFQDLYILPGIIVVYLLILKVLSKSLGKLKIPVMIYMFVFCFLLFRAGSTFFNPNFSTVQSIILTSGVFLFMMGDFQLAIYHFVSQKFPMFQAPAFYFVGQLLIALSASYFPG